MSLLSEEIKSIEKIKVDIRHRGGGKTIIKKNKK